VSRFVGISDSLQMILITESILPRVYYESWMDATCIVMLVVECLWTYFIAEHAADRASELIVFTRAFFNNECYMPIIRDENLDM
jgi:hypothetical protein